MRTFFELEKHNRYDSEVCDATLGEDGRWSLEIKQLKDAEQSIVQVSADALIVAKGSNQTPNPTPEEFTRFSGRIIHSSQYDQAFKRGVAEKKLNVLVVGGGESGADISAELGALSPKMSVWLRRRLCVGPRLSCEKE